MTKLYGILALTLLLSAERATANPYTFLQFAEKVKQATWQSLFECGLKQVDAYHPSLPQPTVPAQLAVVNSQGRILAYTYETPWGFVFKNPNGGQVHSVRIGDGHIKVVTPYQGTVAHANRWKSIGGYHFTYYCRSRQVPYPTFETCIQRLYVERIAAQLCRFP